MTATLAGQVALVTGAGRGIGAAIACELAERGCDLGLVDVDAAGGLNGVAETVRSGGRRALAMSADVTSMTAAEANVTAVIRELGRLDILVCCAGITRDAVVWKMSEEAWDTVLAVNLKGCFTYCRAAAPVLRGQRRGRIVTIASINGMRGKAGQANYAASKAGVIALTKTLARELGPSGVTVNCIAPGFIRTAMTAVLPEAIVAGAIAETALGRLGDPEDVARTAAFLCSEGARHITGEIIKVDGGQYL
ncbi:MAG: 3-oxoacyl-[acyl-carrier-protein] reductase FabG [Gemmatimonadaceae bacterium]|nr:3-oxoacyl-[acyl-carrier-protein] reductase FabG [Gemmatimonadaceae bacterium]